MFFPYAIDDEQDYEGCPYLVYFFIIVYIGSYYATYKYMSEQERENIFYTLGCVPSDFKWWSPITCTFLHGGLLHLIGNLYFFWIYGRLPEKAIGFFRFLSIYVIGAYASILLHCISTPDYMSDIPTIGASGAISAVLGAFLVLFPTIKIKILVFAIIFMRPLPAQAPAYFVLGSWFIVQMAYGLKIMGDFTEVAFWAHVGGFAVGAALGTLYLILHKRELEREFRRASSSLVQAWDSYMHNEMELARKQFFKSLQDRSSEMPERHKAMNMLLLKEIDGDESASANLALRLLRASKENQDYPGALQAAYWLDRMGRLVSEGKDLSLAGALAAAKLKHYEFAKKILGELLSIASPSEKASLIDFAKKILPPLSSQNHGASDI